MKLPEISMSEWAEAEAQVRQAKITPQPKGTITPAQYAHEKLICVSHARKILGAFVKAGLATQEKWRTDGKVLTAYRTVKKK